MICTPSRVKTAPTTVGLFVQRHRRSFVVEPEPRALAQQAGVLGSQGQNAPVLAVSDENVGRSRAIAGREAEALHAAKAAGFLAAACRAQGQKAGQTCEDRD